MRYREAQFYFKVALLGCLVSLSITVLFCLTLLYHSHRDGEGSGLNVLAQFFPESSRSSNMIDTSPFESKAGVLGRNDFDRKRIDEMLVRYYVEMRYSVLPDENEMRYRWGWQSPLLRLSTRNVHTQVVGEDLDNRVKTLPQEVKTVEILSATPNADNTQYSVDFVIHTLTNKGQYKKEARNVIIDFRYVKSMEFWSPSFANPYGLIFTRVRDTEKKVR